MSISRPVSAFSPDFHSNILDKACFVSKAERSAYIKIKGDVQNSFLEDKEPVFVARFPLLDPENPGYSYGMTRKTLKTFQDNIEKSGMQYQSTDLYADNGTHEIQIRVSLPELDLDESQSPSPGWNNAFKGASIKKDFQERVYGAYERTTNRIQSGILANRDVASHFYTVDLGCPPAYRPTVANWLVKDLEEGGGFKASVYFHGHCSSIKISKPD